MSQIRLLIHAPTPEALKRAQNNARNLLKLNDDAEVEIVVNGPAVAAAVQIIESDIRARLVLCNNSLTRQQLEAPAGVRVVAAAVQYLALQQMQGWAYMRA